MSVLDVVRRRGRNGSGGPQTHDVPSSDLPIPMAEQVPWGLISLLLRYPDEDLAAADAEMAELAAELDAGPLRDGIERFLEERPQALADRRTAYVETFDLRRRNSLHLTYYEFGDTRGRGMALLRLKKLYRAAGLPLDSSEMPDHLTVMLAFAELADGDQGRVVLDEFRAPLELLRLSLHDLESPYRHLLDALCACLRPLHATDRSEVARLVREGPPGEEVGLEPFAPGDQMPIGGRP